MFTAGQLYLCSRFREHSPWTQADGAVMNEALPVLEAKGRKKEHCESCTGSESSARKWLITFARISFATASPWVMPKVNSAGLCKPPLGGFPLGETLNTVEGFQSSTAGQIISTANFYKVEKGQELF